jgi:hypothetical protein
MASQKLSKEEVRLKLLIYQELHRESAKEVLGPFYKLVVG